MEPVIVPFSSLPAVSLTLLPPNLFMLLVIVSCLRSGFLPPSPSPLFSRSLNQGPPFCAPPFFHVGSSCLVAGDGPTISMRSISVTLQTGVCPPSLFPVRCLFATWDRIKLTSGDLRSMNCYKPPKFFSPFLLLLVLFSARSAGRNRPYLQHIRLFANADFMS